MGHHFESIVGDPDRDALFHALQIAESVIDARYGWGDAPRTYMLYIAALDCGFGIALNDVSAAPIVADPVENLAIIARHLPDPPGEIEPLRFADSPQGYAGAAVTFETFRIQGGRRVECRVALAADINGHLYGYVRNRGDAQAKLLCDWKPVVPPRVSRALRRIAWKGRTFVYGERERMQARLAALRSASMMPNPVGLARLTRFSAN